MRLRPVLDWLYDAAGYLAAFFIFAIFVLMIGQTAARELAVPTRGWDDVAGWLCAASAFLAMAHTFRRGDFVRVTLLIERLSENARRPAEIAALSFATLFLGYMTWWAVSFVHESWQFEEKAQGLIAIPIWIPQSSFVLGSAIFLLAVADELIQVVRGRKPAYELAVEERHARGDFSEDI